MRLKTAFVSTCLAAALALAGAAPGQAAPRAPAAPTIAPAQDNNVINVQGVLQPRAGPRRVGPRGGWRGPRRAGPRWRRGGPRAGWVGRRGPPPGWYVGRGRAPSGYYVRRGRGPGWYRGYRGSRVYRRGWRRYDGWWFPPAAFALGVIIHESTRPRYRDLPRAHLIWCDERFKTYRIRDNTYAPRRGVRAQCRSPYWP